MMSSRVPSPYSYVFHFNVEDEMRLCDRLDSVSIDAGLEKVKILPSTCSELNVPFYTHLPQPQKIKK